MNVIISFKDAGNDNVYTVNAKYIVSLETDRDKLYTTINMIDGKSYTTAKLYGSIEAAWMKALSLQ